MPPLPLPPTPLKCSPPMSNSTGFSTFTCNCSGSETRLSGASPDKEPSSVWFRLSILDLLRPIYVLQSLPPASPYLSSSVSLYSPLFVCKTAVELCLLLLLLLLLFSVSSGSPVCLSNLALVAHLIISGLSHISSNNNNNNREKN